MMYDVVERSFRSMPRSSLFEDTKAISMPEKSAEKSITIISSNIIVVIFSVLFLYCKNTFGVVYLPKGQVLVGREAYAFGYLVGLFNLDVCVGIYLFIFLIPIHQMGVELLVLDVLYVYVAYELPQLLLAVVVGRVTFYGGLDVHLAVVFLKINAFLECPMGWLALVVYAPLVGKNLVAYATRIADDGVYVKGGHYGYGVAALYGKQLLFGVTLAR